MEAPELGTNLYMWSFVVATVMPIITSLVISSTWSPQLKGVVSVIVSILLGAGTAYFAGQFDGVDATRAVLIIFFGGTFAHRQFWKPSGLGPAIEQATDTRAGE